MTDSIDLATCTEAELWRFVAAHLARRGIGTVLVGGAVVAVYTKGAYKSGDLDFVREQLFDVDVPSAMAEIGFHQQAGHFEHPDCEHLFVEFVSGPLGIGRNTSIVPDEENLGDCELKILSPTDSVCDRLASYVYHQARECLDQAVLVADAQAVDWERIQEWCREEGPEAEAAYAELRRLAKATS